MSMQHGLIDFVFHCVEYIQTIMVMEESVQHVVMTAIQEVDILF